MFYDAFDSGVVVVVGFVVDVVVVVVGFVVDVVVVVVGFVVVVVGFVVDVVVVFVVVVVGRGSVEPQPSTIYVVFGSTKL